MKIVRCDLCEVQTDNTEVEPVIRPYSCFGFGDNDYCEPCFHLLEEEYRRLEREKYRQFKDFVLEQHIKRTAQRLQELTPDKGQR